MKHVKILTMSALVSCAALAAGNVYAGGCMHGYSMEHQAKQAELNDPLMAVEESVQSEADPKWLALLKRRELSAQSESGVVVVPN